MATTAATTESAPVQIPTGEGYSNWRKTGELPQPKEVSTEAESSPATDAEAESSTADVQETEHIEAEAEHEPEPESVAKPVKKRGAEARIAELLAEIKQLKAEKGTKETQAAPSPAPKSDAPKKPNIADFKTVDEYEAAYDKYVEDLTEYKASKVVQQAEFTRELKAKLTDARGRYEDFDDIAKPIVNQLTDGSIDKSVLEAIDDSPVFADLLYVIGGDEGNVSDFLATAKSNPRAAIKKIGALEQIITDELQKATAQPRTPDGKFATEKKVSKAPPPPTEIGGTSGAAPDEVASAAQRGDVRGYFAAANRRDLARRKGT